MTIISRLIIGLLIFSGCAVAQNLANPVFDVTSDPSGVCIANAPKQFNTVNGNLWGCKGLVWTLITGTGGGGATVPNVLTATGGGTTTLTIGGNISPCSTSTCEVGFQNTLLGFTSNVTATIAGSDTTFAWVTPGGAIVLGDTSAAISCSGGSPGGCSAVTGVTQFPANVLPLFSVISTGTTWGTPANPPGLRADPVTVGSGLTDSFSGGVHTINNPSANSVTSFVCDPTNTTDCAATLHALVATVGAAGGGTISLAAGASYKMSTQRSTTGGTCTVGFPYSNITIIGNGATINNDSSLTTGFGWCFWDTSHTYNGATYYAFNAAHRGDNTITLTTAGNATHFTPGHYIWIRGNTGTLAYNQPNLVTAANAGTGVLTLRDPLSKDFTIATLTVADVDSLVGHNIIIQGPLTYNTGKIQGMAADQLQNLQLNNITVYSNTLGSATEFSQLNEMIDLQFNNPNFSTDGTVPIDPEADSYNTQIRGGQVSVIQSSNGTLGGGCGIGVGEGDMGTSIIGTKVTTVGNASQLYCGIDVTESYGSRVEATNVNCGPSNTACIVSDNGGSFGAFGAVFTGNTIQAGLGGAVKLGASDSATFTGNTVTQYAGDSFLNVIGPAQITGNAFVGAVAAPGNFALIIGSASAVQSVVSGNFFSSTASTGLAAIRVADPGSVITKSLVIGHNEMNNFTSPISVASTTNTPNVFIMNQNQVATVTDGSPLSPATAFNATHFLVGSTASGVSISKNQSSGQPGYYSCVSPAASWDPCVFQASEHDFNISGSLTASAKIVGTGIQFPIGNGLTIKTGSNGRTGTGTLSGGTLAVSNTSVTANSFVFVQDTGGGVIANIGAIYVASQTPGTGFTVTSSNVLDTSTFRYFIYETN